MRGQDSAILYLLCSSACVWQDIWPAQGQQPFSRPGTDQLRTWRRWQLPSARRARARYGKAGAGGPHLGEQRRAVAPLCDSCGGLCCRCSNGCSIPTPGCCKVGISADALRAPRADHQRTRGGLGCAERRPLLCYRCGNGGALASTRATAVATRARAHLRERVETRHPPACCLWPRSRHRPAAAKAVSLLSGVVPANRECRSATRLCYRCGDECVCLPNSPLPMGPRHS